MCKCTPEIRTPVCKKCMSEFDKLSYKLNATNPEDKIHYVKPTILNISYVEWLKEMKELHPECRKNIKVEGAE